MIEVSETWGATTLSITTFSIKGLFVTLGINDNKHNNSVIMLSVLMLSGTFLLLLRWLPLCWVLLCWMALCWVSWHWRGLTQLSETFLVLQLTLHSKFYKTLHINNVRKMDRLRCKLVSLFLSMTFTNTLAYYIIRPFSVHLQWNTTYKTPMQENSCFKLPQMSN
jgi:CDP-diglyceride synthetase